MSESKFVFVGNYLCLDFINTQLRERKQTIELLGSFADFAEWLLQAQVLNAQEVKKIITKWDDRVAGASALKLARRFRVVLREMIERIVEGKTIRQSTIEEINKVLRCQNEYSYLSHKNGEYKVKLQLPLDDPTDLILPVAKSAADLLSHADFSLIKKCENPGCILYYYDISKNHKRRWCSMNACGNRMKAAAHYERKKRKEGY